MILEKTFVTNNHVLIQFDYTFVPVKDFWGRICRNLDDTTKSVVSHDRRSAMINQNDSASGYK